MRITRHGVLYAYLNALNRGIDYDLNERIYQALPSVTLQQIVDFEKKNMAQKPLRYIILGNEKELDMEVLRKIGHIRRVEGQELFGF